MPSLTKRLLDQLEFAQTFNVRQRSSINDLLPEGKRTGLYILHLSDDSYYVGMSLDVCKRFQQHRLRFDNIERLSFRRLPKRVALLRAKEREVIHTLDSYDVPLHNKVHITLPYGSSEFDILLTPEEQQVWLESGQNPSDMHAAQRPQIEAHKLLSDQHKLRILAQLPEHKAICQLLKTYITSTVPAYFRSEGRFWALSCLPSTFGGERASVVNMSTMEAFVVFRDGTCFINLADSVFSQAYSDQEFLARYPATTINATHYQAAGFDQVNIHCYDPATSLAVIQDPHIQAAARLLNLSLVRQQATLHGRAHTPGLVSALFELSS
jgi:hypothetical protein